MIECGKCGAKISADRARAYKTGRGLIWKVLVWCEGCKHLLVTRRRGMAFMVMSVITDKVRVRRFVESLPLKPEIQRKQRGAS